MSLPAPAAPGVTGIPQIPGLTREERRSRPSGSGHTNSPGDVPSSGARQGPPVLQPGERAPGRDVMSLGTMGSAPEPPHPASPPFSPSLRSQGATSGEDLAPAWVFEGSFSLAGRSRSWQRAEFILHGMSAFAPAPLCSSRFPADPPRPLLPKILQESPGAPDMESLSVSLTRMRLLEVFFPISLTFVQHFSPFPPQREQLLLHSAVEGLQGPETSTLLLSWMEKIPKDTRNWLQMAFPYFSGQIYSKYLFQTHTPNSNVL